MTRPVRTALAAALVLAVPAAVAAAAGPPESAFVPAGFTVERRVAADYAGDAGRDRVLVLVRRAGPGVAEAPPQRARRLVLLKARSDGGFARIGEGRRILLCTSCGGALFPPGRTPVSVRVRAGVVIVEQEAGSREVEFQRFRLRQEGALRVRLIGVDTTVRDRLTGASVATSTNLLTGARVVTRVSASGARTVRRTTVPVRRVTVEGVDRDAW
jgi:hypothetical protein